MLLRFSMAQPETDVALWYYTVEDTSPVKQDISQFDFSVVL